MISFSVCPSVLNFKPGNSKIANNDKLSTANMNMIVNQSCGVRRRRSTLVSHDPSARFSTCTRAQVHVNFSHCMLNLKKQKQKKTFLARNRNRFGIPAQVKNDAHLDV